MTTTFARQGLLFCVPLLLLACPASQQKETAEGVQVKLRRVDVETASFDRMDLVVIAVVENAGSADVSVLGGDAQLSLLGRARPDGDDGQAVDDDEEEDDGDDTRGILTGQWVKGTAKTRKAAAFRQTEVPIRLSLPLPKDTDAFERFSAWERMSLDVKGALEVGGSRYTFGGTREVATPILPTAVLEEAQVASLDAGDKGVAFFRVGIDNPNVFQIKVDRFSWGVTIGGKELRPVADGSSEEVPPSSVSSFEDSVQLNEETFGPEVKKLLRQPRVPYVIDGFLEVKGVSRPFRFEGEMEFAR
jgi:LEA14-like dessication related protein